MNSHKLYSNPDFHCKLVLSILWFPLSGWLTGVNISFDWCSQFFSDLNKYFTTVTEFFWVLSGFLATTTWIKSSNGENRQLPSTKFISIANLCIYPVARNYCGRFYLNFAGTNSCFCKGLMIVNDVYVRLVFLLRKPCVICNWSYNVFACFIKLY